MSTMALNSFAANPFSTSPSSLLKSAVSSRSCPMFTPKMPLLSGNNCSGWNQGISAAAGRVDAGGLSAGQVGELDQHVPGREPDDGNGSRLREAEPLGHGQRRRGRNTDQ